MERLYFKWEDGPAVINPVEAGHLVFLYHQVILSES
tara:strand:- start:484 stop:591 length:108 start_codon:yes stop_codon:yes gene_type:complete